MMKTDRDLFKTYRWGMIYAVLAACAFVLSVIMRPIAWNQEPYKQIRLSVFTFKNLILFLGTAAIFFLLWKILFRLWNKKIFLKKNDAKGVFKKTFFFVLPFWGMAWMIHFPGTGMNDTVNIIDHAIDGLQPLLHSLLVNLVIHKAEKITGSMLTGYAVYVLLQMIVFAAIVAYTAEWLAKRGVRKKVLIAYNVFFAITPIVANYAIVIVKDSLYSYVTLLILPCIIDMTDTGGGWIKSERNDLLFTIALMAVAFMRSNGELIAFIVLLYCIVKFDRLRGIFIRDLVLLVMISELLSSVKSNALQEDISFREAMSVPMVQMAAVVANEGKISEEQIQTLEKFAPISIWRDKYSFSNVDVVKFSGEFNNQYLNENKAEFLKIWLELGVQNVPLYIRSYLFHMYGFWNLNSSNQWGWGGGQSIFFTTCNNTSGAWWNEYVTEHGFDNRGIFENRVSQALKDRYRYIFVFFGGGQLFWILLLLISFCAQKKAGNAIVLGVMLLNWGSMMGAAPISYAYRYVFYLVVCLPFLLIYFKTENERQTIENWEKKEDEDEQECIKKGDSRSKS